MLILLVVLDPYYRLVVAGMAAVAAWYVAVAGLVWRWTARR